MADDKPKRVRRLTLTKIDGRGRLARRIKELTNGFLALIPLEQITVTKRAQIDRAAQMTALAEEQRGRLMRHEIGVDQADVLRWERKAEAAVKALGLPQDAKPQPMSLAQYLAERGKAK
jgi:hypothetical protein